MSNTNNRSLGYHELIVTLVQLLHFLRKTSRIALRTLLRTTAFPFFSNYYPQPTDIAAGVQNFQDRKQPMKLRHAAGTEFQTFTRQADVLIPK
jgi:hypothetical protein